MTFSFHWILFNYCKIILADSTWRFVLIVNYWCIIVLIQKYSCGVLSALRRTALHLYQGSVHANVVCLFLWAPSVQIYCTVSKTPADLQIRLLWLKCVFSLWKLKWVKSGQSDAHKSCFFCHGSMGRSKKVWRDWLEISLS